MPATNDFLPFAAAGGANVVTQSAYAAIGPLGPGFSSGIAPSNVCNKVWRQSSIMAAIIGDLITSVTGLSVVDDGTTATILANLKTAIQDLSGTTVGANRCIAYVNSSGVIQHQAGTVTLSVTHSGTGNYSLGFSPALPDAHYACLLMGNTNTIDITEAGVTRTASATGVEIINSSTLVATDAPFSVIIAY